jgi:hypothetical protein
MMTSTKKVAIVILSSAAGLAIGYPTFLFVSLAELAYYGDNAVSTEFVRNFTFYGVFGATTLIGFVVGLFIVKSRKTLNS